MQTHILPTWIAHRIAVRHRLERVCTGYLLFLMVVTTKHSFAEAAHFSGLHKSQFCKMLVSVQVIDQAMPRDAGAAGSQWGVEARTVRARHVELLHTRPSDSRGHCGVVA